MLNWKNKRYLKTLILSTIVIAIVPNLIIGIIAHRNVTVAFEHEIRDSDLQYLNQTISGLEVIVKQIQETSKLIVLTESFRNFESFPNGVYYEHLGGELRHDDLLSNYWYRKYKEQAIQGLSLLTLTNHFVDSVQFYDFPKGIVVEWKKEDDEGKTWQASLTPLNLTTTGMNLQEAKIVELPDQSLKMYMRTPYGYLYETTSFDAGAASS